MGRSTQLRPNKAKIAQEQSTCLQLRLDGLSFRAIAEVTGIPLATVHERITAAITADVSPKADELRVLECARLDAYLARLQPKIVEGDDRAINTAVRISESRRKLLGLDMPTRIEASVLSHEVTPQDIELQELLREAKAKNAVTEAAIRAGRDVP
jgi:hypothetical protein